MNNKNSFHNKPCERPVISNGLINITVYYIADDNVKLSGV